MLHSDRDARAPPLLDSPTDMPDPSAPQQRRKGKGNFIPAMANFNIQYNFTSASIAQQVMTSSLYLGSPLYAQPAWSNHVILSAVFVGAALGMVSMGRLGDVLGRHRAMRVTLGLATVGAIIPACAGGSPDLVYGLLCLGRLIIGIGIGGIYPLSAVGSAENCENAEAKGKHVSWAFFWQTPGVLAPYFLAMVLFKFIDPQPPMEIVPQLEFRILFGLGVIPGLIVFFASCGQEESAEFRKAQSRRQQVNSQRGGPLSGATAHGAISALREAGPMVRRTLLGTAGSWFCYDVAFYGISIFTPSIVESICLTGAKVGDKCNQTLFQTAWESVIITSFGIPGALCAIALVERLGSKRLNVIGFFLIALNCIAFAGVYQYAPESTLLLFILFCSLTFFLNFGPNIGTYVLPAVCFPVSIRSTCHGISAMGGKIGAATGTLAFTAIGSGALPVVFLVNASICVLGAMISQLFLKHDWDYLSQDEKVATESFLHGGSYLHRSVSGRP